MDSCPICGGEGFENLDGHYYCLECGTQSQERRDEVEDDEVMECNVFQRLRVKKGVKRGADGLEKEECDMSLHEGWQMIYQLLLDSLIKLGYDPCVKEYAKILWFIYLDGVFRLQLKLFNKVDTLVLPCNVGIFHLAKTKSYRDAKRRKLLPVHGRSKGMKIEEDDEDETDSDSVTSVTRDLVMYGKMLNKKYEIHRKSGFVSKKSLVAVLYLALLYSGQFITVGDMVRLIQMDKLPLHSWDEHLPLSFSKTFWKYQNSRIGRIKHFKPLGIYTMVERVRDIMDIPINKLPLDLSAVGNSLLEKMLLPDSLRSCLRRLLVLYHEINLGKVNYYEMTFFDNKIMVVIVILLKLIYRLDDNFEYQQSTIADSLDQSSIDISTAVYSWKDWVAMVIKYKYQTFQTSIDPSFQELSLLDDPSTYLKFCRDDCFTRYNTQHHLTMNINIHRDWGERIHSNFTIYMKNKRQRKRKRTEKKEAMKLSDGSISNALQGDSLYPDNTILTGVSLKSDTGTSHVSNSDYSRPLFQQIGDTISIVPSSGEVTPPCYVPIDLYIPGLGKANDCYHPVPKTIKYENAPLSQLGLTSSQQFLFNFAAEVIKCPVNILVDKVFCIEQFLRKSALLSTATLSFVTQSLMKEKQEAMRDKE